MSFDTAAYQWQTGERLLEETPPHVRRVLDRVVVRILAELRRRLGGRFTSAELVGLYEQGTTWCLDIATSVAPEAPAAWDSRVVDAAFARYLREAEDYAGGRRIEL